MSTSSASKKRKSRCLILYTVHVGSVFFLPVGRTLQRVEDVCELNKSTAWIWASDWSAVLSRAAPVQVESFQVSPRLLSRLESDLKSFEKSPSRRSNFLKRLYLKVFKSKSSIRQRWQVQTECLDKPSLMLFKKSPSHVTSHLRQVYNKHQVILRPSSSLRSLETYTSM